MLCTVGNNVVARLAEGVKHVLLPCLLSVSLEIVLVVVIVCQ